MLATSFAWTPFEQQRAHGSGSRCEAALDPGPDGRHN